MDIRKMVNPGVQRGDLRSMWSQGFHRGSKTDITYFISQDKLLVGAHQYLVLPQPLHLSGSPQSSKYLCNFPDHQCTLDMVTTIGRDSTAKYRSEIYLILLASRSHSSRVRISPSLT